MKLSIFQIIFYALFGGGSSNFEFIQTPDGVLLTEKNKNVYFYQIKPKSLAGKYERNNYIHPLYDFDGNELTLDFPDDHPHHRGIFWAWHQVWLSKQRCGNAWLCENFSWDIVNYHYTNKKRKAQLKVTTHWKTPEYDQGISPLVEERVTITSYKQKSDCRIIDFAISLQALHEQVAIGGSENAKGYGGFSARLQLPADIEFLSDKDTITPQPTPVNESKYMAFNATYNQASKKQTIAILIHENTPNYPQPWILRTKGSMQNAVYPGRNLITLPTDEPLILKYRIIYSEKELSKKELNKHHKKYLKTK